VLALVWPKKQLRASARPQLKGRGSPSALAILIALCSRIVTSKEERKRTTWLHDWWPLFVVGPGWSAAVVAYVVNFGTTTSKDQDVWGQFGDFVGGLANPLIALFALLMLIRGIRLQREELAETRNELVESRAVADGQRAVMQRQLFESQFFSAITLLGDAVTRARATLAFRQVKNEIAHLRNSTAKVPIPHFLNRMEVIANEHAGDCAIVVALVKVAATTLRRNEHLTPDAEVDTYVLTLRGFIGEFEACLLLGSLSGEFYDLDMKELVDRYKLMYGVPNYFKSALWNASNKENTIIVDLSGSLMPTPKA
jgi:hypothetical protein